MVKVLLQNVNWNWRKGQLVFFLKKKNLIFGLIGKEKTKKENSVEGIELKV